MWGWEGLRLSNGEKRKLTGAEEWNSNFLATKECYKLITRGVCDEHSWTVAHGKTRQYVMNIREPCTWQNKTVCDDYSWTCTCQNKTACDEYLWTCTWQNNSMWWIFMNLAHGKTRQYVMNIHEPAHARTRQHVMNIYEPAHAKPRREWKANKRLDKLDCHNHYTASTEPFNNRDTSEWHQYPTVPSVPIFFK